MMYLVPAVAGCLAVVLLAWVRRAWLRVEILGQSMAPTFEPGDRVLARRIDPGTIRTGDVVVFDGPMADVESSAAMLSRVRYYEVVDREPPVFTGSSGRQMIKRVAAVAGERLPFAVPGHAEGSVVPVGHLAVIGDNPGQSHDSRHHGYISVDHIVGRVRQGSARA